MPLLHGDRGRRRADAEVRGRAAAVCELEIRDACGPVERAGGLYVLLRVPEGAVVHRIHLHGAVIAPPVGGGFLHTRAGDDVGFRFHRPCRIGRRSTSEANSGIKAARGVGHAVADRLVTRRIHGRASHPAITGIRREGSLLRNGGSAIGILDFIPAYSGRAAYGVVETDRFVCAEVPVERPVHRAVR